MNPQISRMTASNDKPVVVFLIGMRINSFWKIHRWLPAAMAMPKMLRELYAQPKHGFLGAESWFGRTTIMVQYWESFEKLEAYAKGKDFEHLPAWKKFNQKIRQSGDVGVWHETYQVEAGVYESIYVNMPEFGLGKVNTAEPIVKGKESARERIEQ